MKLSVVYSESLKTDVELEPTAAAESLSTRKQVADAFKFLVCQIPQDPENFPVGKGEWIAQAEWPAGHAPRDARVADLKEKGGFYRMLFVAATGRSLADDVARLSTDVAWLQEQMAVLQQDLKKRTLRDARRDKKMAALAAALRDFLLPESDDP
eukprot:TRINITY_DN2301_c0_g1_i1.p1 TRINITY_DN2301_c0_g1~~TRINITY_DN2301_c0_g1_i1.p1  ORF type:complete len:154 (-),score=15.23 TRINITY_DN2301_c0_g1_i1:98-559(-)